MMNKSKALLNFLKDASALRRTPKSKYDKDDPILWLSKIPKGRAECSSPFTEDIAPEEEDSLQCWLEVKKKRMPVRPPIPAAVADWINPDQLDKPNQPPDLRDEITILVDRKLPDPDSTTDPPRMITQKVPESRKLKDFPRVQDEWLEYLCEKWESWAQSAREWRESQDIYDQVDSMRRRIEEAEERWELLLCVGLLFWRNHRGQDVMRHLLVGPAEIEFVPEKGILRVVPAGNFESMRLEFDMLEFGDQPRTEKLGLEDDLQSLEVAVWRRDEAAKILRKIANTIDSKAQVLEAADVPPVGVPNETPHVYFAPAIILRPRRPTAYDEILAKLGDRLPIDGQWSGAAPWDILIAEGETPPKQEVRIGGQDSYGLPPPARTLFPLASSDEQRRIIDRLSKFPCVVVKGPPGTGKSHTIANLLSHLLAAGERVLVTAQMPKALTVLRDMLPADLQVSLRNEPRGFDGRPEAAGGQCGQDTHSIRTSTRPRVRCQANHRIRARVVQT